ncbi:MAG: 2OG-Fe(II) oxygenase [Akkermansiaceae bacterium]|nr:2OG-Fe(II) oxygenase [Akkermansiaceae bacterium]MCP5549738.1 2OG-Fe(II) oxygenase [Akkermansiaceae bacterium]
MSAFRVTGPAPGEAETSSLSPSSSSFDPIVNALAAEGFAVVPHFLDPALVRALREESAALREEGAFRRAAVGRGTARKRRAEIRSDRIFWLEVPRLTPAQAAYWGRMEGLRLELNRALFLGLFELEAHLACYPEGAFYLPHLDRHTGSQARVVSVIAYLNDDWREADGGQLRLYTDRRAGIEGPFRDFLPEAGTLAVFLSAEFWHEVLPARRERHSLTGWFRRRGEEPVPVAFE